jgi:hypothetical protein
VGFELNDIVLKFGTANQLVLEGEVRKTSINIRLVRNGLVIAVDCANGIGMEHIAPASATSIKPH